MDLKKNLIWLLCIAALTSCDLDELNQNPNVPNEVPLSTLLPPAEKALCDARGGRIFRYSNIFSQQLKGVDGQEGLVENYNPDELFIGDVWSDIYVSSMINLRIIIDRADAESAPHYAGVARVLMANALGVLTDVWGDVPYTQGLQGAGFPNPAYDNQENIYQSIDDLLIRALSDLSQAESVFSPESDDLIYGGDLDNWTSAASVLRARYLMHSIKRRPNAYADALAILESGTLQSSSNDLEYRYLGTGTDINPISSFYSITPYAIIDADFTTMLQNLDDPRISFIFKVVPFTGGQRKPGDYYSSPTSPIKLISYAEELFLKSEAYLRNGNMDQAQTILTEAIQNNMAEISGGEISAEDIETYIAANGQITGTFEADLKTIITQKYIALFTTLEPWTEYRRTGYPELVPNENNVSSSNPNGEIPRRLIYPQSERLRNSSFPSPAPNMQNRFWWDQ